MISRAVVYDVINEERDYQDSFADKSETDGYHTVTEFLLYMEDYLNEARHRASTIWGPRGIHETLDFIRKVTALGVACMEQNGAVRRGEQYIER